MNILHVTAHLGGGVGKAHAALAAAMPLPYRQHYLLLEQPRDNRYAEAIEAAGHRVEIARELDQVAERCVDADIVQFEFWNHPRLLECLARTRFPEMRSLFWSHISGLFPPVIAPGLVAEADRFVLTTPASLELPQFRDLPQERRDRLAVISGAFGFAKPPRPPEAAPGNLCYLGTVDFIKMHPGIFAAIDALQHDEARLRLWGAYEPDGAVAQAAAAMRHPHRVMLEGMTGDPAHALSWARIFFYPLRPDHYGTGENALIEAMSLGLVPVVLANPAECAIVRQGQTGFIASSIEECSAIIDRLIDDPQLLQRVGQSAMDEIALSHAPVQAAKRFAALWEHLARLPKRAHAFTPAIGSRPIDWYRATRILPGETLVDEGEGDDRRSKGSLAHFRAAFPDPAEWDD
ncbi:glycosyltransferase [Rhizobium alvei]|uniref:Glycosyltransferase n=1 Tax=Rhizobium alvei TaxID=1132659 RepID=A0ABT8YGJ1_9HYPH|nr:glycosyltransferase [Rhizobium alvei]MDO6962453.1 glycosyltransferase [Rhizobium alvei]